MLNEKLGIVTVDLAGLITPGVARFFMSMNNGSISRLYGRPRDTSFSWLSLRFRDPLVERQFHQSYVAQSATLNRSYMLVGLLAYLTYSVLDFLVLTDDLRTVLWIRLAISGLLVLLIAMTYWRRSYRDLQFILVGCVVVSGSGIVLMTAVLSEPFSYLYYAGLILIIIYSSNLLILRYMYSVALSVGLLVIYMATTILVNPIPQGFAISNMFFITVTVLWTSWTSYWQGTFVRRAVVPAIPVAPGSQTRSKVAPCCRGWHPGQE